jgi:hypothetical protein
LYLLIYNKWLTEQSNKGSMDVHNHHTPNVEHGDCHLKMSMTEANDAEHTGAELIAVM